MINTNMKRRTFLKVSTIAGGSLLVGCSFSSPKLLSTPHASEEELGVWVRISTDNKITLILPASEMGQQAHTGQAMLVAEELEADWETIQVTTAPFNAEYKKSIFSQSTGGSESISKWWERLRKVGAGTREILITAAAQKWGVPESECKAKNGQIQHLISDRKLSYGQLASTASKLTPPNNPILKNPKQFRLLGKSIPKLHTPDRVNGTAQYGIDVRRPVMLFATVSQSPVFGGQVKSYDESAAKAVNGVKDVILIPNGVAVVADSTWHAKQGLEALKPQFEGGESEGLNSTMVNAKLRTALEGMGKAEVNGEKVLDLSLIHI